jgi:hypothetical protein
MTPGAQAAPGISVAPGLPTSATNPTTSFNASVTVAATGDPAQFEIAPGRSIGICTSPTPADSGCDVIGTPWDAGVTLTPSCGQNSSPSVTVPVCQAADTGVITLNTGSAATGAPGTMCEGTSFTIVSLDASTGMYKFVPQPFSSYISLGGPGTSCRINFTANVAKFPTVDASPDPGLQTRSLVSAGGWYHAPDGRKKKVAPLKAVGDQLMTITCADTTAGPPPDCTPPPPPPPPPTCKEDPSKCPPPPLKTLIEATPHGGGCSDNTYRAAVTVSARADLVDNVTFAYKGRTVGTVTKPTGLLRFVLRGRAATLPAGRLRIVPTVTLKGTGSFSEDTLVQVKRLGPIHLEIARDCHPTKAKLLATCVGKGSAARYQVSVRGLRDAKRIARVRIAGGPLDRTLRTPNDGLSRWTLSGSIVRLGQHVTVFHAWVYLRKGVRSSFKKFHDVSLKKLGPKRIIRSQACDPPPPPPAGR